MIKYTLRKGDILLIACVLLIALLPFALRRSGSGGAYAVVYVGSEVYGSYPLQDDAQIDIAQEDGSVNRVRIEGGRVSMAYSTCKNQICVLHEAVSQQDEWIVCLPNRVSVTVAKEAPQG